MAAVSLAMERLYQARDLIHAQLLRDALTEAGIATELFNQHAQGALGEIPFTHTAPELWLVEPHQRRAAEAVIEQYERPAQSGSRRCPHCGEENPAEFGLCWHCQQTID